ncbi:MAG: hypothetical protein KBS72_06765 [Bacteroidales bacterium]|nr:hypothetical protein [Candidatus Cacconaster scatequi]
MTKTFLIELTLIYQPFLQIAYETLLVIDVEICLYVRKPCSLLEISYATGHIQIKDDTSHIENDSLDHYV